MAGIYSCGGFELLDGQFLSVHLSGGTTEILKSCYSGNNFINEIIGGTKDISAGQFIDRTGVRLGMRFPAGAELEKLAAKADTSIPLPISVDGSYMSFSGVETKVSRMADGCDAPSLAKGVLAAVAKTLVKAINNAVSDTNIHRILIVGGVASNEMLRNAFENELCGKVYFAKKEYSSDNAVGTAYLAQLAHNARG
jgi:N6-L-threonylcarbamoyladenine synthase